LEPLGVALHGVTLSHIKPAQSAAIIGAGPIGLCILQVLKEARVDPVFVIEKLQWRLKLAERFGARVVGGTDEEAVQGVMNETGGRGVDVAFEAAWSDVSVQRCAEMVRPGGKLIVAGISKDDTLSLRHTTARRKGLTILMVRRMKHTYPHAIDLVLRKAVNLKALVSHRFQIVEAPEAFALNAAYSNGVVKVIIFI
jgi:L-iditol 2-dehydrogenase